ncbi:MAG: NAD(P)/FAD-dependent oxidoreductase [Desulfococcaceae bacterium]
MERELVVVGGGHAHLTVLKNLAKFGEQSVRVTVVNPDAHHFYSGMGPGMLAGTYRPEGIRFDIRGMTERGGGRFVEDAVVRIDPGRKRLSLASGLELPYDVASFNTGSGVPFPIPEPLRNRSVFPVKPIVNLMVARERILERLRTDQPRLIVAGGGPAGVEMAGNLRRLADFAGGRATITLVAGRRMLHEFPERARKLVLENFLARQIEVIEETRIGEVSEDGVSLEGGDRLPAEFVFLATGVKPSPLFADSGLETGPDGGLAVNRYLQSASHPELFGGGDCIYFTPRPLDRVGVYAVRQNPLLLENLLRATRGETALQEFEPQKTYMLILNLGDGQGLFIRKGLVWRGGIAWKLKDYIDSKFMREMQASD